MASLWKPYVLWPLWILQTIILVPPLYYQAKLIWLSLVDPALLSGWTVFWLLDFVAMLACLLLVGTEFARYRAKRLDTGFYLKWNAYKILYWVWNLVYIVVFRRDVYGNANVRVALVQLAVFALGITHAVYVWYRGRRLGRSRDDMLPEDGHNLDALSAPKKLNCATSINKTAPLAVRMAMWAKRDPAWMATMPPSVKIVLSTPLWLVRYMVCYSAIIILLPFTGRIPGETRNHWNENTSEDLSQWDYPKPQVTAQEAYSDANSRSRLPSPFPHGDEEAAVDTLSLRTIHEDAALRPSARPAHKRTLQPSPNRLLGPRYLCFIVDDEARSYMTKKVEDWMAQNETRNEPDYVFISYTRQQFYSQIYNDPTVTQQDLFQRRAAAERDKAILTEFGTQAAREANVPAFWIDFECVQPEDDDVEDLDMEDVYRICDIVRGSHSLTIICGPTLDKNMHRISESTSTAADWLLDWGKRLWTLPEALLCPSEHRISIYAVGNEEPERIAKRNLPGRLWDDAATIRQLIDHYEASLQLTKLELISIALECLQRRQTEKRNAGDVAYALMGLLRLRPKVNKADTDFQAFARLSLANDSDMILERLICLRSPSSTSSWHDMQDLWDAKLWHIDPMFQVAEVGHSNTIIIGDAAGTSIDWTSLKMIDFTGTATSYTLRWRYIRTVSAYVLAYAVAWWIILFTLCIPAPRGGGRMDDRDRVNTLKRWTYPWIVWTLVALPVPYMLSNFFQGTINSTQARVFGFVGVPDIDEVERALLGDACGRLKWNLDGSVGGLEGEEQDQRPIFTLVDTLSLTLTTFRANRPPTMMFVGGRERGLLRILLCSYDSARRSFVKETVTRLESVVSTGLPRLDRFHFSVQPELELIDHSGQDLGEQHLYDEDLMELPDVPEFISLDD
ncbi:hypothetical protein PRZ48_000128 [Zasmidium cellare]|uniref:3-hydroxyisobutyrate dehydrogenase protein n=1 Tax=Zasmidium cellare TaxID=395010 RepID=A0ABR0EZ83_ZASCE|nr:hypothetical protein PRZ48_000128 [Zasmidium cellare]